jgi:hypothetical protein
MPVKIARQKTSPQEGIIHISDVHRMLTDFRKKIIVDCTDPSRNPIQKRFHFDIDFERLVKIAKTIHGDKKTIRINLSLNLLGQLNCNEDESIENSLSILVCGVEEVEVNKEKIKKPLLKEGHLILVEGFKDNDGSKVEGDPCCVQGIPFPFQ